jgi:hypothetical protein
MESITPEATNILLQLFESDNPPEQSPTSENSVAWQGKCPLSWSDFRAILLSYCHARHWEITFGEENDMSLAIFANEDQATNGTEDFQGRLPFAEEDALPF